MYFVTWRLRPGQTDLCPQELNRVVAGLRYFDQERYDLFAFVVMNDHVHVLLKLRDDRRLEDILHSWKSFTAREFQRYHGRRGAVWQDESFDRIVRDEDEFWQKVEYILGNPGKRWAEFRDSEYRWSWIRSAEEAGTEARPTGLSTIEPAEAFVARRASGDAPAGTEARPTPAAIAAPLEPQALGSAPADAPAGTEACPTGLVNIAPAPCLPLHRATGRLSAATNAPPV